MRHKIGKSIKQALTESSYSDIELSNELGLTRTSVYLWRKKDNAVIRKSNLIPLAKLLNKKISYEGDIVEFSDIKLSYSKDKALKLNPNQLLDVESNDMGIDLKLLLQQKDNHINLQANIITGLQNEKNQWLKEKAILIESRDNTIDMSLDHNRLQFIVNMEKCDYVTCTQYYADIYGKMAFDIMNNHKWTDLVHEDDNFRFPIIMLRESDDMRLKPQTWKVKGKKGKPNYVETYTTALDEKGVFKKIDATLSNEEKWIESNKYYKSFPKIDE